MVEGYGSGSKRRHQKRMANKEGEWMEEEDELEEGSSEWDKPLKICRVAGFT